MKTHFQQKIIMDQVTSGFTPIFWESFSIIDTLNLEEEKIENWGFLASSIRVKDGGHDQNR